MEVVILTRRNPISYYVVNNLDSANKYYLFAEKNDNLRLLWKKYKRFLRVSGLTRGFLQCIKFILEIPYLRKEKKKMNYYLADKLKEFNYNEKINVTDIDSVNNITLIDRINKIDPKIIIVIGTAIISSDIIDGIRKRGRIFINWHSGITPEYRGCMAEFYCILNNEISMAGSTLHEVDSGVDTGKVVMQKKIDLTGDMEKLQQYRYWFLRYRNTILAVEMLNEFFDQVRADKLLTYSRSSVASRLYSTPRKRDYINYYKLLAKFDPDF